MQRKLIIVFALIAGIFLILYNVTVNHLIQVHDQIVPSVELSGIKDSTYRGSYSYLFMQYKVAVVVKDQKIKEISILKNGKRKWAKMAEGVIPRVINAQNTSVDAVSGATTTSKALQMAIYDALTH